MKKDLRDILEYSSVGFSAPCRVDMGGTLDIATFHYPLRHLSPSTFNIALDIRTTVRLSPHTGGRIRIASRGFETAEFEAGRAPYDHPMGLMFAACDYFSAAGVSVTILSGSPPRSALGGSSVAAVALVAAFMKLAGRNAADGPGPLDAKSGRQAPTMVDEVFRKRAAMIAHGIEAGVAGVPCGFQDQLAAAFGGVSSWQWGADPFEPPYERKCPVGPAQLAEVSESMLVAYCGRPHVSKDINGRWVREFIGGGTRRHWEAIALLAGRFTEAFSDGDYEGAAKFMAEETAIRREMTPDVVDAVGADLVDAATDAGCGARFTGAGGGGCLWALGGADRIRALKGPWAEILSRQEGACLLPSKIDTQGLRELGAEGEGS